MLFHEYVHKSEEEKLLIQKRRDEKKKLKEKRKKIQTENKRKKELQKQEHKEKSLNGMKKKESDVLLRKIAKESVQENQVQEDDDAQYYREEVGEEPDKGKWSLTVTQK